MAHSFFTGKTLLITGGTGSFGNAVLNRFLETDIGEIRIFSRDEKKQDDKAHFIELVAASALFDFLKREKPERQQFLTRAIEDNQAALDLKSLGSGYKEIVKRVADYKLLEEMIDILPKEKWFPLPE